MDLKMSKEYALQFAIGQRDRYVGNHAFDASLKLSSWAQIIGMLDRTEDLAEVENELLASTQNEVAQEFIAALTDEDVICGYIAYDLRVGKVQAAITEAVAEVKQLEVWDNLEQHKDRLYHLYCLLHYAEFLENEVEEGTEDLKNDFEPRWTVERKFRRFQEEFIDPLVTEAMAPYINE